MEANFIRWESGARYYAAWLQRNLFGELELVTAWGGKGNRRGGSKFEPVASAQDGVKAIQDIHRRRLARHYLPVSDTTGLQLVTVGQA